MKSMYLGLLCSLILCSQGFGRIVLTEVMFDVQGADYHDEYIEIKNISQSDSIDMGKWYLEIGGEIETLAGYNEEMYLAPGQYCIIFDGSYINNSTRYEHIIPDSVLRLTISDKAFGKSGLPNTKDLTIGLYDAISMLQDIYTYSSDNEPGYSDEKIIPELEDQLGNWKNSIVSGGSPGKINSVSPRTFDLSLKLLKTHIDYDNAMTSQIGVQIDVNVFNAGISTFNDNFYLHIWKDENRNSILDQVDHEVLIDNVPILLTPGDSLVIKKHITLNEVGKIQLLIFLDSAMDQNKANDTLLLPVEIQEFRKHLIINEIQFLEKPEWIELYNTGNEPVQLTGWELSDARDTCRISSAICIDRKSFVVLASDSLSSTVPGVFGLVVIPGFPSLSNSADTLSLLNPVHGLVEFIPYTADWLEQESWRNPSLERIAADLAAELPSSWGPCMSENNSTPGEHNSIAILAEVSTHTITAHPNPFSPDNDGFEDYVMLTIRSPVNGSRIRVQIFDVQGRNVRTLCDNRYFAGESRLVWDGKNEQGRLSRIGIYIVYVMVLDDRRGILKEFISTVTVARQL